jgi:uncharacterized protein YjbI with pentapeptide repeats
MKIFKKNEHSLFIKPFGIRDKIYMATTVMVYYDLTAPAGLLTEQELWKTVPPLLGETPILDQGMAKPRGEVLLAGSCCAPRGTRRPASQVTLRVGNVRKTLSVFGDRYWVPGAGGMKKISEAEPFEEIPLTWNNAFGGEGFAANPAGKGINPVTDPNGRTRVPLPNIEDPRQLVGSPQDRPDPAGFFQLDIMAPLRQKKAGTYDDKWLKERWPYFPDDMNYEFFNAAPEDQYLDGFFRGDEEIELGGMHPDMPLIRSKLPNVRIRLFVTRMKSLKATPGEDELFIEVPLRIDTLWLFPGILRGVALFRGTTEILDEEYADVRRIFIASEKPADPPQPLEYYRDEQLKVLNRMVPLDPGAAQQAQQKIQRAMLKFKQVPKIVARAKEQAMGKTPVMPVTPADMVAKAEVVAADGMDNLARLETLARGMHAKFGHLVEINLEQFDAWRARIGQMLDRVKQTASSLEKAKQKSDEALREMGEQMKRNIKPEYLEQTGVDPDNLWPAKKVNPWHDRGFPFVVRCRKALETDRPALARLKEMGFSTQTIHRAWLGLNGTSETDAMEDWGLKPGKGVNAVDLPAGLVMPRFQERTMVRVRLQTGWPDACGDVGREALVPGSDETPLFLPCAPGAPVVRVATELEAYLVEQEIGEVCSVIALREPGEKPDQEAAQAIQATPVFLVALPEEGSAAAGDWEAWIKGYPNAKKLHLKKGTTVLDARRNGIDIRDWILDALPPESIGLPADTGEEAGKTPPGALTVPPMDIKGMIEQAMQEIRAFYKPKFDAVEAECKKVEDQVRGTILKAGKDPDEVFAAAKSAPKKSFAEAGQELSEELLKQKESLRARGLLTPEVEAKFDDAAAQSASMGQKAQVQYVEGMAKIEAGKKELAAGMAKVKAGEMPDSAKEKFREYGMDPDRMKKRTREEVVDMHARGETLAWAILSGVDLSGLDLRGADFTGAQCTKTKFAGSRLDGAVFARTICNEADFTEASLVETRMDSAILAKVKLVRADLSRAALTQCQFNQADLSEANLTGAKLKMISLDKAKFPKSSFPRVEADLCVFGGDASDADFRGGIFRKCIFRRTKLDRADFSGAALNQTLLTESEGEGVVFQGANLDKGRMGNNCRLAGADFRNIRMKHGCFKDSDLSGAAFGGSVLHASILENCDLQKTDFRRVSARQCRFTKSNFEGADLRGLNLMTGSLRKARLVQADLRGANLFAVDLYKSVMGETRLDGANLKLSLLHKRTDLLP